MITNCKLVDSGVTPGEYLRQTCVRGDKLYVMSRSDLHEFYACPSKWIKADPDATDDTKSTRFGSLVDCLVLTPDQFEKRYAVTPEMYPCTPTNKDPREEKPWTRQANYCAAWEDERIDDGFEIVKPSEFQIAELAARQAMANELASEIVSESVTQVMVKGVWEDRDTGLVVPLKCLIDFVPRGNRKHSKKLGDFKTCASAQPDRFEKSIWDYWYDAQAWMSREMYVQATGEDRPDFDSK